MRDDFVFSIVIAIYNTEKYLSEAIDSIVNQTFPFEKIQLILVDDGSTDTCGEICKDYQKKYPKNIKYIYKENGGQTTARNMGMEYAEGTFVNFLDSDDKFELNALEEVHNFFEKHGEEIDVVSTPRFYFGAMNRPLSLNYRFSETRVIDIEEEYNCPQLAINCVFIRRSALTDKFDSRLIISEDASLINKIILKKGKYGVVNTTKYMYRRREEETSTIDTGKLSKSYFIPRLNHYMKKLINQSIDEYGYVLRYVQYAIMFDLQWMYEENTIQDVLNKAEFIEYEALLYEILQYIDDDIIMEQKYLDKFIKCHILEFKHDKSIFTIENTSLKYGNIIIDDINDNEIKILDSNADNNIFYLKGVFESCFRDIAIKSYHNGHNVEVTRIDGEEYYSLGNKVSNRFYFEIATPLLFDTNEISFYVEMNSQEHPINLADNDVFNINMSENKIIISKASKSNEVKSDIPPFVKANSLENKNEIFTLWISEDEYLPETPLLSLKSMVLMNHEVILYTYTHIKNVPPGVIVKDANEIYDKSMIFRYKDGYKSYSGFANLFRLKRLYEQGGTWIDLDIILIKNLNDVISDDIIICSEPHWHYYIHCNNAILRFPKGDPFVKYMYDYAVKRGKDVNHGETGPHLISKQIFEGNFTSYAQFVRTPIMNNICGWWEIKEYFSDPRVLLNNIDLSEVAGFHLVNTFFNRLEEKEDIGVYGALKKSVLDSRTHSEYVENLVKNGIIEDNSRDYYDFANLTRFHSSNVKITFLIDSKNMTRHDLYFVMGSIERSEFKSNELIVFGENDLTNERISYRKTTVFINSQFRDCKEDIIEHIHGEYIIPINKATIFKKDWFKDLFKDNFDILKINFERDSLNVIKKNAFNRLVMDNSVDIFDFNINRYKSSFSIHEMDNKNLYSIKNEKTPNEVKIINLVDQLFNFNIDGENYNEIKQEMSEYEKPDNLSYYYTLAYENVLKSDTYNEFMLNCENAFLKSQINWYNKNSDYSLNLEIRTRIDNLERNLANRESELENSAILERNLRERLVLSEGKTDHLKNRNQFTTRKFESDRLNLREQLVLSEVKNDHLQNENQFLIRKLEWYENNLNELLNSKHSRIIKRLVDDEILEQLNLKD